MNIGFYGHSAASWYGNPKSFIDQVKERLNCNIVNVGVAQGSEERVLFDLKKTKKLDIAIIFHQHGPRYMFLPKCNRDITVDTIPENKSKKLPTAKVLCGNSLKYSGNPSFLYIVVTISSSPIDSFACTAAECAFLHISMKFIETKLSLKAKIPMQRSASFGLRVKL